MAKEALPSIPEIKIKFNDVFHLKNLYVMMHEYLVDEGWTGKGGIKEQPNSTHMDIEKFYFERVHQNAWHKGGNEVWAWWRLRKAPFPSARGQGYFDYKLEIDFHGMYLQKVEIMHQGKKIKVDKGELEIVIRAKIARTDEANKWKDHWLLKWWQDLYEKRIMKQDIDKMEKDIWREAYRLQGVIKAYLNLRNFIPVPEPFHPVLYGMEGQF